MTDEELWLKHVEEYPQIKTWSAERQEWARKGFMSGLSEGRKELENENIQLKTRWHIVPEYYLNEAINKFEELEQQMNKMKCIVSAIVGFLVTFAICNGVDLIVIFVKWFTSHWN